MYSAEGVERVCLNPLRGGSNFGWSDKEITNAKCAAKINYIHNNDIIIVAVVHQQPNYGGSDYHTAGNFCWCKISQSCHLDLQKNFSGSKFRTSAPDTYRKLIKTLECTSQILVVLIFVVVDLSTKTMKFCTMRKFSTIRYLLA